MVEILPECSLLRYSKSVMDKDAEFLEFLVKALVDNPEDVKIKRDVDEMGVLMTLDVNPQDMGKIIGREGNTADFISACAFDKTTTRFLIVFISISGIFIFSSFFGELVLLIIRLYPADSTIFTRSNSEIMFSSNSIKADSEAKLTEAECIPAVLPSTRSIVATQLAQCIP